jgi:hypothetical protein
MSIKTVLWTPWKYIVYQRHSPRILSLGTRRKREGCRLLYPGAWDCDVHSTGGWTGPEALWTLWKQPHSLLGWPACSKVTTVALELHKRRFLLHCLLTLQVLCCWSHTGPKWVKIYNRKIQINFGDGLVHWIADMRVICGPVKLDQLLVHIFIVIIINPIVLRTIFIIIIIDYVNGPVI